MKNLCIFGLISLWTKTAFPAPCCGSVATLPSLMGGDDRTQIQTSFSLASVSGEAADNGFIRRRAESETDFTQKFAIAGSALLSDRIQGGVSLPLLRRVRGRGAAETSSWGLSDISANVAYEWLPEFTSTAFSPKGFVYLSLTAPTGISEYETAEILKVDVRGRGFWSAAAGAHFSKSRGWFDAELLAELRRSFPRTVRPALVQEDYRLTPGWGTAVQAGIGIRPKRSPLRIGLALGHHFEESVSGSGVVNTIYASQAYWSAIFSTQCAFADGWMAGLSYIDQTLVGGARNVALSRISLLTLQKSWER